MKLSNRTTVAGLLLLAAPLLLVLAVAAVITWMISHILLVIATVTLAAICMAVPATLAVSWYRVHRPAQRALIPVPRVIITEDTTAPSASAAESEAAPSPRRRQNWEPVYIGKTLAGYSAPDGRIVWGKTKPAG